MPHRYPDHGRNASEAQGRWRFASPNIVYALTAKPFVAEGVGRGNWNGVQGTGFCPCHHDRSSSLRFAWKDDGSGTMVWCHAGCPKEVLFEWFNKKGYWLDRPQPSAKRTRGAQKPITVEVSVAYLALTANEQRMYQVIKTWRDPSYDDFVKAGIRRTTIPDGILVLACLGLITGTRTLGKLGYERNHYELTDDWKAREPASGKDRKAAIQRAKDEAFEIRHGRERRNKPNPPVYRNTEDDLCRGVPKIGELGVPLRGAENATPLHVGKNLEEVLTPCSKTVDEGERTVDRGSACARARDAGPDHKPVPFFDKAAQRALRVFAAGDYPSPEDERIRDEVLIPLGLIEAGVGEDGLRWERVTEKGERYLKRKL
jgi:hypothetical protein